jgi:formamidopyrimidine-DNA glycosylase
MPELPEVETIRRKLRDGVPTNIITDQPNFVRENGTSHYHVGRRENGLEPTSPSLIGKRIQQASLLWEGTLAEPTANEFLVRIMGQTIIDFGRRAKYLLVQLSDDVLVIHLRMSGDLLVEKEDDPIAPHHRFMLHFEDGFRLAFNDTRKFGRIWLMDDASPLLAKLGPEPLDRSITSDDFYRRLNKRKRQLKPLLMDQSFIAGVGNIYADEALHRAKLHPQILASALTKEQAVVLLESIRHVLLAGIEANGASIDWVYRGGDFQNQFQVYQRGEEPCYQCGTPIRRIVVGQRGTHFCPRCQPYTALET